MCGAQKQHPPVDCNRGPVMIDFFIVLMYVNYCLNTDVVRRNFDFRTSLVCFVQQMSSCAFELHKELMN